MATLAEKAVKIRKVPGMTIQYPSATTHTGSENIEHIQRMQKLDTAIKAIIAKKGK